MKTTIEIGIVFEQAQGPRLAAAECLLTWFSRIFRAKLAGGDLAWCAEARTIVAFLRFAPDRLGPRDLQQLRFWTARAGGRARRAGELTPADAQRLQETIDLSQTRAIGLSADAMELAIADLCTAAGLDPGRRRYADDRPVLAIDVGGPHWASVRWDSDEDALFIASPIAPPLGDALPVIVHVPGWARRAVEWTRVASRRDPEDASPGHPAGFSLAFDTAPAELRAALARNAPVASHGTRVAPRFQLGVPIRAVLEAPDAEAMPGGEVEQEGVLVGWVENLSMGGAFVRVACRPAVGTELKVRLRLPTGARLESRCVVASSDAHGVGLRFVLDPVGMAALHEALTLLSAHPRRALVIDDDSLARQLVADALVERGFEVLTAADARVGLQLLADEALAIDLLVTDLVLPGIDGEELVSTIRRAGGESDLVVVVMTGSPDARLAARLQAAGADLLTGKGIGPELIALKADELLEARRRPAQPAGGRCAGFPVSAPSGAEGSPL